MAKRLPGLLIRGIGVIAIICAFVLLFFRVWERIPRDTENETATLVVSVAVGLFMIGLVPAGAYLIRLGKRLSAVPAEEAVVEDTRAPILYLRSFQDEAVTSKAFGAVTGGIGAVATEEEMLAEVLREIGPVIAIGRPGERLPQVGAARYYATGEAWQALFLDLLSRARLVVLRAGPTRGLAWEFEQVLRRAPPTHVIILVPRNDTDWLTFCDTVGTNSPATLPALPKWVGWAGSLRGYVTFDNQWRGQFTEFSDPPQSYLRTSSARPFSARFKWSFRPVFEACQVRWTMPRIKVTGVLAVLRLLLVVLAICAAVVLALLYFANV